MTDLTNSSDKSVRRLRKRRSTRYRLTQENRVVRVYRSLTRLFITIIRSGRYPAMLLLAYFFIYANDFTILLNPFVDKQSFLFSATGGRSQSALLEVDKVEAESFKASLGLIFYASALFLMLGHFHKALKFSKKHWHLIFMFGLPLVGIYISVIPEKVLYSVIQLSAGISIGLAYAITHKDETNVYTNLCVLLLIPILFIHTASGILFFYHDLNFAEFFEGSARYGGLGGNPNTLGTSAAIGFWLALYVLLDRSRSTTVRMLCLFSIFIFVFSLVVTGSGTSKATVAIVLIVMLVVRTYISVERSITKLVFIFSLALLAIIGSGVYFINNDVSDLQTTVTSSLGKEETFTGRSDIWLTGYDAIVERPLFGWGLDSHETVLGYEKFEIPNDIRHYHNGSIDTIVSSGLVAFVFVLYNLFKYIVLYLSRLKISYSAYGMAGPLVILFVQNLSEYSLMRPNNIVFQLYLVSFCLIAVQVVSKQKTESLSLVSRLAQFNKEIGGYRKKKRSRKRRRIR